MKVNNTRARWQWRLKLDKGDDTELLNWINQSGLERVARIVAVLTDAGGERGQPEKPESLLLLKIAHLTRQQPARKLHGIVDELARETHPNRKPRISLDSFISKLERDFRKQRHTWMKLVDRIPPPSSERISHDASRLQSITECRVLARLIGLLPTAIDLYDQLRAEAKRLGENEYKLVQRVGRERAEQLLIEAIKKQQKSSFVINSRGARIIPRNFYELIEAEMEALRLFRNQSAPKSRKVGRK